MTAESIIRGLNPRELEIVLRLLRRSRPDLFTMLEAAGARSAATTVRGS